MVLILFCVQFWFIRLNFTIALFSHLCKVASIMKISSLHLWVGRPYSRGFRTKALECMLDVSVQFLFEGSPSSDDDQAEAAANNLTTADTPVSPIATTPNSASGSFMRDFFTDLPHNQEQEEQNNEYKLFLLKEKIKKEVEYYTLKISDPNFKSKKLSTKKFWSSHVGSLPNLRKLAIILLNINSSSAFIERFLSICGVICNQRNGNMKDDIVELRSLLKANIEILRTLNEASI